MTALATTNVADGLVLDHVRLGLDHDDLDYVVEDEQVILAGGDGPLLTLHGWDRTNADDMHAAAEWLEVLARRASDAATELRRHANSLCDQCAGTGLDGPDDRDCRRCQGSGVLS